MENRSIFIVTAAGTFVGTIAVIIIEKWKRIMEYVADPEVKSSVFASVAIIIGLYILLYGFWRLVVKPYIDNVLKVQNKKTKPLIIRVEFLTECMEMVANGKAKSVEDVAKDITLRIARRKDMEFEEVDKIIQEGLKDLLKK